MTAEAGAAVAEDAQPTVMPFDYAGVQFELRVRHEPSGLAGQVFHGQEFVAGIRLFHSEDVNRLQALAVKDRAFLRAVERLAAEPAAG
jgi:hypothetical protein